MVIVDFGRNQNNQKGLTPANGISPNFISLQKVLSDSNNKLYDKFYFVIGFEAFL